ncbi:MAG TPA: MFS transporter [Sphingomonadaceae bacterium]|nr:MFS transporter [Sphingomonadaceae bacterium]
MPGTIANAVLPGGGSTLRNAYTIGLFTLLYMFMYVDRNILNLLLESIKKDFALSDTVLALIAGFGFSFFHTVLGFPAARWADKGDRRIIITLSAALWSGMTLLCGLVQNGLQLALARIGVGIGEATTPVLHSILSDQSTKDTRARVMAILMLGGPLAALFCYPIVGWFDQHYGWRHAFVVAGVPGLVVGALVWLTFRDKAREAARKGVERHGRDAPSLRETLRYLFNTPTFLLTAAGYVVSQIGIIGFTTWAPAYLRRIHDMSAGSAGASFGVATGLLGIAGGLSGAYLLQRSNRHGDKWKLLWPAIATFLAGPAMILTIVVQSTSVTLFGMGAVAFCVAFKFGPIIAANQSVSRPRMRAMSSSIQGFAASLIAIGGGPLLAGAVSDALRPSMGDDSLKGAFIVCAIFTVVGSTLLFLAARSVERDIRRAEAV